jgi:N-acetylmuramic acid 6-phosphate etherase
MRTPPSPGVPALPRERGHLLTERRHPGSIDLDRMSTRQILELMHAEDRAAAEAVGAALDQVERAAALVLGRLRDGGRLLYVGAGTSGRLGVLDAAECPPTFGTPPGQVVGILAGGPEALVRAREGAEDDAAAGAAAWPAATPSSDSPRAGPRRSSPARWPRRAPPARRPRS